MGILINSDGKDLEVINKEQQYFDRLELHRSLVLKAFNDLIANLASNIIVNDKPVYEYADAIRPAIENHDKSKFEDEEFYAYREHWLPTVHELYLYETDPDYKATVDEETNNARIHHLLNNDHHPEFWCKFDGEKFIDPTDMSIIAILHMICDWQGMSYEVGGSAKSFWFGEGQKHREHMTNNTIDTVNHIMTQLPDTKYKPINK